MLGRLGAWGLGCALLCGASVAALTLGIAPAVAQEKVIDFNIAGGSLSSVLTAIGSAAATPISFSPTVVENLRTGPIVGRMSVGQAVSRALSGTKLRLVTGSGGMLSIVDSGAKPSASGAGAAVATDIADIDVSGNGTRLTSDPLSTEGSNSYAVSASNVATKTGVSIQETPKSVSVISNQQIKDRNITTLDQAVAAMPGLTVQPGGGATGSSGAGLATSNLNTAYQSRGFTINSIAIDGGQPITVGSPAAGFDSNFLPIFDLSSYDSISIVRGSAGQYSGSGSPGGVLSLQRKRPLAAAGGSISQDIGSFNTYRTVGDISTGDLLDGLVRIRSSFVYDDRDYFYRFAGKSVKQGYVNVEITPAEQTRINLGATINETIATPWIGGLPTYPNGTKVLFSRDTCLCAPWAKATVFGREYFVQAEQDIVDDWTFHFNGTINQQLSTSNVLVSNALPNHGVKSDNTGLDWFAGYSKIISDQYSADAYINGKDEIFGISVEPIFGFSYSSIQQGLPSKPLTYVYPGSTSVNVLSLTPWTFPQMPLTSYTISNAYDRNYSLEQLAAYTSMRISPLPWLHVLVAERFSTYQANRDSVNNGKTTSNGLKATNLPIPDVGVTIDLDPTMSIYGSYATIFQPQNQESSPGTLLGPMTGQTWEAGIKRTDLDGALNTSLAFYTAHILNYPTVNYASPYTGNPNFQNCCYLADGATLEANGVDFESTGKLAQDWDLTFSYNFNDNRIIYGSRGNQDHSPSTRVFPRHLAKLFTVFRLKTGWSEFDAYLAPVRFGFGAEFSGATFYTSQIFSNSGGKSVRNDITVRQSEGTTFNALIQYLIDEKTTAQLTLTNLLDRKYYSNVGGPTGGNWYAQGFSAIGSVRVNF
ncbi:TonB-dependent receptor plug domain-containing protein [Methylobacterium sp. 1030]|uniref:TonB-dependent siderophore receptor n=1 Tax=Methylobacterium sp. 1030 TaxID=3156404 RepID=UPI003398BCD9